MSRKEGVNADEANSGKKKPGSSFAKKTSVDPKLEDAKTLYTVIKDKKLWEFGEGDTSAPQALTQV